MTYSMIVPIIIFVLILSMVLLSFFIAGDNKLAALTFSSFILVHELFFTSHGVLFYCDSDVIISTGICMMLLPLKTSDFIFKLMIICATSIILSCICLVLWENNIPVYSIDACFAALYVYVLCLIGAENGGIKNSITDFCIYRSAA